MRMLRDPRTPEARDDVRGPDPGTVAQVSRDAPLDLTNVTITELRHRIKNLIAVVQGLVAQSLRSSASLEEAARAADERLVAIARSVDLLLRSDWGPLRLGELVELALPHAPAYGDRVSVDGPEIWVDPDWAVTLMLALGELETNAIKYGALSGPVGRVTLSWTVLGEGSGGHKLSVEWAESDGPHVVPSGKMGFGTRLATTVLQRALRSSAEIDFVPTGLVWRLLAPLPEVDGT